MNASTAIEIGYPIDLAPTARQPLDAIFAPKTVAVIGASEQNGTVSWRSDGCAGNATAFFARKLIRHTRS
jgi:hypothetical protein